MSDWHVWTITINRYEALRKFLDRQPEIKDILYPVAEKEYDTKSGTKRKDVPLYSNYLFLKYKHGSVIASKLESCSWIHNHLGTCSKKEMKEVRKLNKTRYEDLIFAGELQIGMQVKLIGTPFKDMMATLVGIDGNRLAVSITIFGAERIVKCFIDDIDVGEKMGG